MVAAPALLYYPLPTTVVFASGRRYQERLFVPRLRFGVWLLGFPVDSANIQENGEMLSMAYLLPASVESAGDTCKQRHTRRVVARGPSSPLAC